MLMMMMMMMMAMLVMMMMMMMFFIIIVETQLAATSPNAMSKTVVWGLPWPFVCGGQKLLNKTANFSATESASD